MDPIQALEMLGQVVKGIKLPYTDHVLLERSLEVLRTAIQQEQAPAADLLGEEEPVIIENVPKKSKDSKRRGERRKK